MIPLPKEEYEVHISDKWLLSPYKYLSYQHWKHISKVMGYSEAYIYEMHEDALEAIADKINYTVT